MALLQNEMQPFLSENHTESQFNAQPRTMDSFVHRWTIDAFNNFYHEKSTGIPSIHSNIESFTLNGQFQYSLSCYPNGEDDTCADWLSVYFCFETFSHIQPIVRFRASILDAHGNVFLSKVKCRKLFAENYSFGFDKFILSQDVLNSSNQLLSTDMLLLLCEGEILEFDSNCMTNHIENMIPPDGRVTSWIEKDLARLSKLQHVWTITNFSHFYEMDTENGRKEIFSQNFFNPNNAQLQFYLVFKPMKYRDKEYLSLFLACASATELETYVDFEFSILDQNGKKNNIQGNFECLILEFSYI